jgi:hypothetical protein
MRTADRGRGTVDRRKRGAACASGGPVEEVRDEIRRAARQIGITGFIASWCWILLTLGGLVCLGLWISRGGDAVVLGTPYLLYLPPALAIAAVPIVLCLGVVLVWDRERARHLRRLGDRVRHLEPDDRKAALDASSFPPGSEAMSLVVSLRSEVGRGSEALPAAQPARGDEPSPSE